ncbi:hypothetical protein [Sphaerisporangium fuscum]|uniref:hypothetical protein n=1 Tax=Sphaerisporangium fuscum TaxID=2835868 RepID=UPI001BDD4649|nr:hypothetical protein [Sphaerisporangium fuscum]
MGTDKLMPQRTWRRTEMTVHGITDGKARARVTVRTKFAGAPTYLVTPTDDRPEFQFPLNQVSEVFRWLTLLARDELH